MKNRKSSIAILLLVIAILVGYLAYSQAKEKKVISECSEKATQAVKKANPVTVAGVNVDEGNKIYDISFKSCLGKNGYER